MEGRIFDIQRFSTHDGPGIRTILFLKGCPLRCVWCHNPESQRAESELLFHRVKCIGCGCCEAACPYHEAHRTLSDFRLRQQRCRGCSSCADVCVAGAIERVGQNMSVEEVVEETMKDVSYFRNSGGGVTLSGGEPMAQPEFTIALLAAFREKGVHTAMETSGQGRAEAFRRAVPVTDLFLWDVKTLDKMQYAEYTGGDLSAMLDNLHSVYELGGNILLRSIFIPELHDNEANERALAKLLDEMRGVRIEYIPYHQYGKSKFEKLGRTDAGPDFRQPEPNEVADFARRVEARRTDKE